MFDPHRRLAAGMPEHVRVDFEANLSLVAGAGEQLGKAGRVHGPPRFDKNTNGEAGDASAPAMLV